MAKDIFIADYSNCRDTYREIQSNMNYIDNIVENLSKVSMHVNKVSVSSDVWDKSDYDYGSVTLNNYLSNDRTRYENFYSEFKNFYTPIESIDSGLKSLLENSLSFIDENEEYDIYMSIIQNSQMDSMQNNLYDELIKQGVSELDARKLASLLDKENQAMLNELLLLNEDELISSINEIKDKLEKTPFELLLIDVFSADKANTYSDVIKDFAEAFATGGLSGVLQGKFLGGIELSQYNRDISSLTGQISRLQSEIAGSQLSRVRINPKKEALEKLKAIKEAKVSKINKLNSTTTNLTTLSKCLNVAGYLYIAGDVAIEEYKNATISGEEIDDIAFDIGLEVGGVAVGIAAGTFGTSVAQAAAAIGTGVAPGVGTVIGWIGGFVFGAIAGVGYSVVVKPLATDVYNNYIEPIYEEGFDKINEIGDWWDVLWW